MASTKLPLISAPRVGAPPLWRTSRAHPPTSVWRNEGSYCRHHGHGGRKPLLAKQPQNKKSQIADNQWPSLSWYATYASFRPVAQQAMPHRRLCSYCSCACLAKGSTCPLDFSADPNFPLSLCRMFLTKDVYKRNGLEMHLW